MGELMSQAGREVLIKVAAPALPTFLRSVFKFPHNTCDDLSRMIRNYWWGSRKAKGILTRKHGISCCDQKLLEVWV